MKAICRPRGEVIERRTWSRLPLAVPVFVRGVDRAGQSFLEFATAVNISAGGLLVAARRPLAKTAKITVEIAGAPVPSSSMAPSAVRVLRCRMVRECPDRRCHLVALKFAHPLL